MHAFVKQRADGDDLVLVNWVFLPLPAHGEFYASFSKPRDKSCLAESKGKNKRLLFIWAVWYMGNCQRLQPKEERHTLTICHIHCAVWFPLFHYVNLKLEFNKWMNLNVKPMVHLPSKTKTQTCQNNRALKRESVKQHLLGAAPQATGWVLAHRGVGFHLQACNCCEWLLVLLSLGHRAGSARLAAVFRCLWCVPHFPDGKIM